MYQKHTVVRRKRKLLLIQQHKTSLMVIDSLMPQIDDSGTNTKCVTSPPDLPGVKDAVVDAVEELYLKAATGFLDPRQAAMNMVTLAQGSTLGLSAWLIL